tara:strand:+ start:66793 stop:68421 length:1629 start_codon:yes stop_codon:yes gene_type:complete
LNRLIIDNELSNEIIISNNIKVFWSGDSSVFYKIEDVIKKNIQLNNDILKKILISQRGHFSFILKYYDYIFAAVDIVSSYPIFYSFNNKQIIISNSAGKLKNKYTLNNTEPNALFEFYSSSYVTGENTIYSNLFKIRPGEMLCINSKKNSYNFENYFSYKPTIDQNQNKKEVKYLDELDKIMNSIFLDVIEKANGDPIWIPLSGGLDSRFIASKLKSLNCPNLFAFSYGPKGNYEAKAAKKVAKILEIPWIFIKSKPSLTKKLFQSSKRKEYWNYSSGYYCLPSMMEYEAICQLKRKKILDKNSIIINGQTGDFITGGHIPKYLIEKGSTVSDLIDAIIDKHYSIWENNHENRLIEIKKKIVETLGLNNKKNLSPEELASYYECWEWQSRQSMAVLNGQRLYDFYEYRWMLPLWEKSLVSFYKTVPLKLRLDQNLFLLYLNKFNYRNLFMNYRSENRRWNFPMSIFLKVLSLTFRILNLNNNNVYKYFSYWSHYSNQYSFYGIMYFINNIKRAVVPPQARGVLALGVERWLEENINSSNKKF